MKISTKKMVYYIEEYLLKITPPKRWCNSEVNLASYWCVFSNEVGGSNYYGRTLEAAIISFIEDLEYD